ncbi:hypothetical protein H9X57_15290 [Flavobacterium piscinae]|uniref:hypothetical protein n=1 Tax=Flavobacterium piscinae TaxID=2506424 RepID=UPI0019C13BBA|nr:hypothetical protein [Flavobacterium piscinae]MBC8884236.1 hypothetical protein [Flavobacterium piscinae]
MVTVACAESPISNLNINDCLNLQTLYFVSNQITTLDISSNVALVELTLDDNNLTFLDASSNINLNYLSCYSNNLESLFIKNGQNETLEVSDNPNLQFICADNSQIDTIQNQLNVMGMTTAVVNSYCTFTPGGNYNTISGTVLFDEDENGCDENDSSQSLIKIKITEGNSTGYMFTNSNGEFNRYVLEGDFELEPIIENETFLLLPL